MRRSKGQKNKKSEVKDTEETNNLIEMDTNKNGLYNNVETSSSQAKKQVSRGREKSINKDDKDNEKQMNGNKKRRKDTNESIENHSDLESDEPVSKKKNKENTGQTDENYDGEEYEVEKIVAQRTIKGRRQFLVRWKGYTQDSDTWEQEKELNCDRLIEEFLTEQEENNEKEDEKQNSEKKNKGKKYKKKSKKGNFRAKIDSSKSEEEEQDTDDSKEYEVEKIIEVYIKKDKSREFLIRWKGFSSKSDTWEPEENLNCPELIQKFMQKLEKIRNQDSRELRANPSHTNRYTLTMYGDKRQSRRNINKQRKTYYECD